MQDIITGQNSKARSARTLYIRISKGYIPPYSIEKNYLIAMKKRNLLLRKEVIDNN